MTARKAIVAKDFHAAPLKSDRADSRYGMTLFAMNDKGVLEPQVKFRNLLACGSASCDKREESDGKKFRRCTRCKRSFCSPECQKADHKGDKLKACKKEGGRIARYVTFYSECKVCSASFEKHIKYHNLDSFDECRNCFGRHLVEGSINPENGKPVKIYTPEETLAMVNEVTGGVSPM